MNRTANERTSERASGGSITAPTVSHSDRDSQREMRGYHLQRLMLRVNRVGIARLFSLVCLFRCSVVLFEYYLFSRYADVCFIAMCVVAISFI